MADYFTVVLKSFSHIVLLLYKKASGIYIFEIFRRSVLSFDEFHYFESLPPKLLLIGGFYGLFSIVHLIKLHKTVSFANVFIVIAYFTAYDLSEL